ncbi:MAG: hypothetical protein RIR00_255 [Pseudomonadota bacterium]
MIPHYWQTAKQQLAAADPVLGGLIAGYPDQVLASRGEPFVTLARSIVGQQISVKAADSVWARFSATVGTVQPEAVLTLGEAGLQGCGLSRRKIEYMVDLARHFTAGQLGEADWPQLDDAAIIARLTDIRGIGRWTAEMFLIFNLLRPDVLPVDDIGLQKAVWRHYFAGEKQELRQLRSLAARWAPWRTVATWYLWHSLDPVPVAY